MIVDNYSGIIYVTYVLQNNGITCRASQKKSHPEYPIGSKLILNFTTPGNNQSQAVLSNQTSPKNYRVLNAVGPKSTG